MAVGVISCASVDCGKRRSRKEGGDEAHNGGDLHGDREAHVSTTVACSWTEQVLIHEYADDAVIEFCYRCNLFAVDAAYFQAVFDSYIYSLLSHS